MAAFYEEMVKFITNNKLNELEKKIKSLEDNAFIPTDKDSESIKSAKDEFSRQKLKEGIKQEELKTLKQQVEINKLQSEFVTEEISRLKDIEAQLNVDIAEERLKREIVQVKNAAEIELISHSYKKEVEQKRGELEVENSIRQQDEEKRRQDLATVIAKIESERVLIDAQILLKHKEQLTDDVIQKIEQFKFDKEIEEGAVAYQKVQIDQKKNEIELAKLEAELKSQKSSFEEKRLIIDKMLKTYEPDMRSYLLYSICTIFICLASVLIFIVFCSDFLFVQLTEITFKHIACWIFSVVVFSLISYVIVSMIKDIRKQYFCKVKEYNEKATYWGERLYKYNPFV